MAGANKLLTAGGGGVILTPATSIASDKTMNIPSIDGTLIAADASGNVGIGTSSLLSTNRLTLNATSGNNGIEIQNSSDTNRGGRLVATGSAASGSLAINTTSSGYALTFGIDGAEKARIDTSGNWLVGTTAEPNGTSAYGSGFIVGGASNGRAILKLASNTTGGVVLAGFYNPNGLIGSIQTSASATSYVTSSDYRLKENAVPMTGALYRIAALKPVTYTWKVDGSEGEGFIAHELAEVCPHAVVGEKDAVDADGNPVYQGIDTSFLVATLTAAIQEQQAQIEQLKADVALLKGQA